MSFVCAALLAAFVLGNQAQAQCCKSDKAKTAAATCNQDQQNAACSAKLDAAKCCRTDQAKCAAEAACRGQELLAAEVPLITYKVGDKVTRCPNEAQEMAGKDASKIRYVVTEKEYTDKDAAMTAYATALEEHLAKMTQITYVVGDQCMSCPNQASALAKGNGQTVKYRVAGVNFEQLTKAESAMKLAGDAAQKVQMSCVVDGKKYQGDASSSCCASNENKAAAEACKTGRGKCEWVIGDTKTDCRTTAQVALLQERIVAVHKAVEQLAGA